MASASIVVSGNTVFPHRAPLGGDLSDCSVVRDPDRPWLAVIIEPLLTDAPETARPWRCLMRTVVFYEEPLRLTGGNWAEHDRIETRITSYDVIHIDGETFEIRGGGVIWRDGRWVMFHNARKAD